MRTWKKAKFDHANCQKMLRKYVFAAKTGAV